MKIKSSDTFFPTKFRPTTANTNPDKNLTSKSYKLVRKRIITQQSGIFSQNKNQTTNIFKNQSPGQQQFNFEKDKPVGGLQSFMKQHNKKNKDPSIKKLSFRPGTPETKKKQNQVQSKHSYFFSKKDWLQSGKSQQHPPQRVQTFKSHYSYKPTTSFQKSKQNEKAAKSQIKFQRNTHHDSWVVKQTQEYQTKMGVLNEIYYKRPLVDKYGDRYFQFYLRNRYQQDFYPPCYIHQIKSDSHAKTANNDKFISKIKKINPNVRNFQKLVVKGKHLANISCNQSPKNI